MTTRTVNNFKTLRELLDFNDVIAQSRNIMPQNVSPTSKHYTINKTSLLSVTNWNAIYSNAKLFNCMMLMLLTILSQLVFSYIVFALVNVKESVTVFYLSQALNLILSYILPLALISELEDILENPFSQLAKELQVYKQLRLCVIAQSICVIVSITALVKVFRGGPYVELRYSFQEMKELPVDMTVFIRVLQIISFQLTLINLILAVTNFIMTNRKIRSCINRIERLQNPEDLEVMFNHEDLENKFEHNIF